jgi:hypothetical protein
MKQKQKTKTKDRKKKLILYENRIAQILKILCAVFFIIITSVYPLFLDNRKYFYMTTTKTVFYCVFTGIAAAVVFCVLLALFFITKQFSFNSYYNSYNAESNTDEPKRPVFIFEIAILSFLLLTFISALLSYHQDTVWYGYTERYEGFYAFLCYVLTFFIIARYYKPKHLHFIIFAFSAVLVSLCGVLQFAGYDIFKLFPFTDRTITDAAGNPLYGNLTAYFRTTLGNINVVSAYCSIVVVFFAAIYSATRSKWSNVYLGASIMSFALLLVADSDGGKVGVGVAMVLLIPFWISDRVKLGKILIVLSGWCGVYAGYNAYLSILKSRLDFPEIYSFAPMDANFLWGFTPKSPVLFVIISAVLLLAGLCLIFILKKWAAKPIIFGKIAGIAILAVILIGGLLFVEIMGAKWADQPTNLIWQIREIMHGRFEDTFGSYRGWVWKRGASVILNHPVFGTGPDTFYYALGEKYDMESMRAIGFGFDKAHNVFIQIAVCMGIPALLAYIIFLGNLFFSAVKKAFERPILFACGAAALSYLIQSFFCVEVPIVTPLYWAALGVVAGEVWLGKIGVDIPASILGREPKIITETEEK